MVTQFFSSDEPVLFTDTVRMFSWGPITKNRILIVTGVNIYVFNQDNLESRHPIESVIAIVKS